MTPIPPGTYTAVHAKRDGPFTYRHSAYVRRVYVDDQQRRCTQILAVCDSTIIDNDAMVDAIAESLTAQQRTT